MNIQDYYNHQFRTDFQQFWQSLKQYGSVSRCRGSLLRQGHNTGAWQNENQFSCWDLSLFAHDHLKGMNEERLARFACSLFYTILMDQLMYCHFSDNYREFYQLTRYPKMDSSCEWAGGIDMARPHAVLQVVSDERTFDYFLKLPIRVRPEFMKATFKCFAEFMVDDIQQFFLEHDLNVRPSTVLQVIVNDEDCTYGEFGELLKRAIANKQKDRDVFSNHLKEY